METLDGGEFRAGANLKSLVAHRRGYMMPVTSQSWLLDIFGVCEQEWGDVEDTVDER